MNVKNERKREEEKGRWEDSSTSAMPPAGKGNFFRKKFPRRSFKKLWILRVVGNNMKNIKNNVGTTRDTILNIIAAMMLAALFFAGIYSYHQGRASKNWQTTDGVITESKIKEKSVPSLEGDIRIYSAKVQYQYSIGNIRYTNDWVASGKSDIPEDIVKKYPVGKKVTVYYNPQNCKETALETGPKWGSYYIVIFFGFLIIISALIPVIMKICDIVLVASLKKYSQRNN